MIAAGDNLNFFPMGAIFRRGGAFFIRRSFRGDRLYAAVVDAYVRRLLRSGYPVELFLEGGRIQTAMAGGTTITASRKFGDAMLIPKGSAAVDTLVSGGSAHEIVVAIKDHAATAVPNTSGLPLPDDAPAEHPKVQELRGLPAWSEGQICCSPERQGAMTG